MLARRVAGLPLEHVVGWAGFHGHRIAVDPGVFVPRRRTEALVAEAVVRARRWTGRTVVVDLCCGSGAVGFALAAELNRVELHATDVEPAAVRCARRNIVAAGGEVHAGDLFDALPDHLRGRIDILAANTPYVPTGEIGLMPPEARDYEPRVALDGGPDGLAVQRRVASVASHWLAPGGHVLVETSENQAQDAAGTFAHHGLQACVVSCPEMNATVVIGTRPAAVGRIDVDL